MNKSLATKIGLWLSSILLMIALFGWDVLGDMNRLQQEAEIIEASNHQSHELHAIELGIHQNIETVKKYLITGDYRLENRFLQGHSYLLGVISGYVEHYNMQNSAALATKLGLIRQRALEVFGLPLAVGNMEGPLLLQDIDRMTKSVVEQLSNKHHALDNQVNQAMNMMHGLRLDMRGEAVALLVILLISILMLTHFIYSHVVLPLTRMRQAVQQVGEGDFLVQCDATSQDEIGALGAAFNAMGKTLQEREQMLNQARNLAAYQEKMNALGFMSAGIAHEVGNPLAVISLSLQVAKKKIQAQDTGAVAQQLDICLQQTERMESIIQLILNFGRHEQAEGDSYFSVAQVMQESTRLAKMAPDTKKVPLSCDVDADLPQAYGSSDKLSQVLLNLLLNALDACKAGGEVHLHCFALRDGIGMLVKDTGHGISPAQRDAIFKPNFTTKAKGEGTGLGLAISQALMQSMGGSLDLMPDEAGQGARFQAWLPTAPASQKGQHEITDC